MYKRNFKQQTRKTINFYSQFSRYSFWYCTYAELQGPPNITSGRSFLLRLWQHWRGATAFSPNPSANDDRLHGKIVSYHITGRNNGQLMGNADVRFECSEAMVRTGNCWLGHDFILDCLRSRPKRSPTLWRCWC